MQSFRAHSGSAVTAFEVGVRTCVWACFPHVCTRMWRPEDNAGVLLQTLSTIFEGEVSVTGLEFYK